MVCPIDFVGSEAHTTVVDENLWHPNTITKRSTAIQELIYVSRGFFQYITYNKYLIGKRRLDLEGKFTYSEIVG